MERGKVWLYKQQMGNKKRKLQRLNKEATQTRREIKNLQRKIEEVETEEKAELKRKIEEEAWG